MREGGIAMWVVLAFGLTALISAIAFAGRPAPHSVRFVVAMMVATLFAALNGFVAGVANTLTYVTREEVRGTPDMLTILLRGISESLANPILGFTLLTLAAFVTAVGLRRLPRAT